MIKLFLIYIIFINLIGLSFMYIDKRKAIKNKWRVRENTLMFISLIGGSLGVLLGMHNFRHKTKHKKFTIGVPLLLIVNIFFIILIIKYLF